MAEQKIDLGKTRDFSENINDTFLFLRQNFKPLLSSFLAIAGIFMLTSSVVSGLYQSQFASIFKDIFSRRNTGEVPPMQLFNGTYFFVLILSWLNYIAMQVAVVSYIKVYHDKNGETPSLSEVWDVFRKWFIIIFFYSVPMAIIIFVGMVLCILPGIYFAVAFVPFTSIVIMENKSFGEAFNRCFQLIKNNFWLSLGIYFITYLIAAFSGGIISLVLGGISGFISYFTTENITAIVGIVVSVLNIFAFIFYIVYYIAGNLHYFSLAEKLDGTGLMKRVDSIGGNDKPFDNIQEQY